MASDFGTDITLIVVDWLRERGWSAQTILADTISIGDDSVYCFCGYRLAKDTDEAGFSVWTDFTASTAHVPLNSPTLLEDLDGEIHKALAQLPWKAASF